MYLTDEGFVISGKELLLIGIGLFVLWILVISSGKPKSTKSKKQVLIPEPIEEEEEKKEVVMEFKETIADVPFAYNEKTKTLKIGDNEEGTDEIELELREGIAELRRYVDRLEKYVEEPKPRQ